MIVVLKDGFLLFLVSSYHAGTKLVGSTWAVQSLYTTTIIIVIILIVIKAHKIYVKIYLILITILFVHENINKSFLKKKNRKQPEKLFILCTANPGGSHSVTVVKFCGLYQSMVGQVCRFVTTTNGGVHGWNLKRHKSVRNNYSSYHHHQQIDSTNQIRLA